MSVRIFPSLSAVFVAVLVLYGSVGNLTYAQKEDYLSDEEIEQLREAQDPPERIKLLVEMMERRLDKARSLKDPDSVKPKAPDVKTGKKKGQAKEKKEAAGTEPPRNSESQAEKSFAVWMDEYLQCLEEVEANLENFSSVPLDPKGYLKSLNKLDESLHQNAQWIEQLEPKLDRSEKKIVEDTSEVLQELSADVKAAIEKAEEQITLLKEAQKARSSRKEK
jgi:hypothetical protein